MNYMDYGRVAAQGESIKGARLRNKAMEQQNKAAEDQQKQRDDIRMIQQQHDSIPAQVEALEGKGYFKEAQQLRESWINTQSSYIDLLEQQAPLLTQDNWKQTRSQAIQAGLLAPEDMPMEYDGDWIKRITGDAKKTFTTTTRNWEDQGALFSEDIERDEQGNITWRSGKYRSDLADKKSGKGFEMKAADSNAIRGIVDDLGDNYDLLTGKLLNKGKLSPQEKVAVQERAAKIFTNNREGLSHAESVARALRQLGRDDVQVRDLTKERQGPGANDDPLGIRKRIPYNVQPPLRPN
jgi:hypothetical protein